MTTFIAKPEEITPEWLTEHLVAGGTLDGEVRVEHADVKRIGTGQLAACYAVELQYSASTDAPERLVAKLPSQDEGVGRFAAQTLVYSREAHFYRDIGGRIDTRTPTCYFADATDDHTACVILMEDLSPARELGQIEGCSAEQAKLALENVAAMHGASWESERLSGIEWLQSGRALWQSFADQAEQIQTGLRQTLGELLDEEHLVLGDELAAGGSVSFLKRVMRPRCLLHSDYRLDNLLYDAADGKVPLAVVDWQSVCVADGTIDASYFVGGNLPLEERREHEEALMRHYHDALEEAGAKDYSWDECWLDYRINAIAGYIVGAVSSFSVERTERGDQMLSTMVRRSAQQMLDHDSLTLLG